MALLLGSGFIDVTTIPCFYCLFAFVFQDRVSLYSPGFPGTRSVDQACLKLRDPPASAPRVLGLKACATTWLTPCFYISLPAHFMVSENTTLSLTPL